MGEIMFKRFAAIALLLALAGTRALADPTLVGTLYDSQGTSALILIVLTPTADAPQKAAGIDIKYQHLDEHYKFDGKYDDLTVTFMNTDDWQKFVSLWTKARSAQGETDAGDYFAAGTLLTVSRESDGEIAFTMAGNPNANNVPQSIDIFRLQPKDFAAFDETAKKVSAYFEK